MRLVVPVLLAAMAVPVHAAAQTPRADGATLSVETRAQDLYASGRDRFRLMDYAGALDDFHRSLDLVDSPNTRMYLGRALRRLGRLPEAFATLDRAAVDAERRAVTEPRYAATRDSARAESAEVRTGIALVTVRLTHLPAHASLRVGGAEVPVTAIGVPLPFVPGEVVVEFDAPGYAPARQILILTPGDAEVVALAPRLDQAASDVAVARTGPPLAGSSRRAPGPPAVATPRPWSTARVLGAAALSTGAAALVTGVVFGAIAWSEHQTLRGQNVPDDALATQGERHRDVANALLASGAAVAVSGVLLLWLGGRSGSDSQRPPVQVDVGLNAAGPTVRIGGTL